LAVITAVEQQKARSEAYLQLFEQLKASIINVAELAVRLYEQGKRDGLPNKLIRADIELALHELIGERRLRQILPPALKRAYRQLADDDNIASVNSAMISELPESVFHLGSAKLLLGDCSEVASSDNNIPDDSIDLIFTDPLYDMGSIPLYSKLGEIAFRVLKPGGNLITYFPQYALPEIIQLLTNSGLKYNWICFVKYNGNNAFSHNNHVIIKGKPLLWFYKGDKLGGQYIIDFMESKAPNKSLHEWQQTQEEAEYFISKLTNPRTSTAGGLVLDPFMGTGTTGLAALKANRRFIGIDINPEMFAKARASITEFQLNKYSKKI